MKEIFVFLSFKFSAVPTYDKSTLIGISMTLVLVVSVTMVHHAFLVLKVISIDINSITPLPTIGT